MPQTYIQTYNHLEARLKREITKLYKTSFGKGPETTTVRIHDNIAFATLEGGLTQLERSLIETDDGAKIVRDIRDQLLEEHFPIYTSIFEEVTNTKLDKLSYAISNDKSTVYIFLIFDEKIKKVENTPLVMRG